MAKTRSFSIYLLKDGNTVQDALKEGHNLKELSPDEYGLSCDNCDITVFLSQSSSNPPWWKAYLGINNALEQRQEGVLVFITDKETEGGRTFVLTFGNAYHKLKEGTYVYDFGLRTTLNAIDPEKIRATETVQPDSARRQRSQSPSVVSLNFFDFDRDQSIIKTLVGKVKDEYKDLFKSVTGVSSLKIMSSLEANKLLALCVKLYEIYNQEAYKLSFPDLQNISPIKDPLVVDELNQRLIDAYNNWNNGDDESILITIPEMLVEYQFNQFRYKTGKTQTEELSEHELNKLKEIIPQAQSISEFKKAHLALLNEDGHAIINFSLDRCLVFDCVHKNVHYHLCDGSWYSVEFEYIQRIENMLNNRIKQNSDYNLPSYNHANEGAYNESVPVADSSYLCLDRENIAPQGYTSVEPCDLIREDNGKLQLFHIKRNTRSSSLSHLFKQGEVACDLLLHESSSRETLKSLLEQQHVWGALIDNKEFHIIYGVITSRSILEGIKLLPLFSRISLYRVIKSLDAKRIDCSIVFIPSC